MELFEVSVSMTVCVVGEDAHDALQRAKADREHMVDGLEFRVVKPLHGEVLPPGWDGGMIPFGDTDGVPIKKLWQPANDQHNRTGKAQL